MFDELMHQLLAHDPLVNPAFLTNKFIDGLSDDIKSPVLLQRPKDLDTVSSLAILQEDLLLGNTSLTYKKLDSPSVQSKTYSKQSHSSTGSTVKSYPQSTAPAPTPTPHSAGSKPPIDEKLANPMSYHKARGLCFKCGAKWGPQHKCQTNVPLQLVEEHQPSVILVNSGSSHNLISESLASQFSPLTRLAKPMTVKVADGAQLFCTHEVVNCSWSVHGQLFTTTFKVLPLTCYDAILGMEWLEAYSPMQIQWKQKWLNFMVYLMNLKLVLTLQYIS